MRRQPGAVLGGLSLEQLRALTEILQARPGLTISQISAALDEQQLKPRATDLARALRGMGLVDGEGRWNLMLPPAPRPRGPAEADMLRRREAAAERYNDHAAFLAHVLDTGGDDAWLFASIQRPARPVMLLSLGTSGWWVAVMRPTHEELWRRLWKTTSWERCPTADLDAWSLASGDCAPARGEEFVLICARPERTEVQRMLQMALMRRGADSRETTTVRRLPLEAAAALPAEAAARYRAWQATRPSAARSVAGAAVRQGRRGPVRGVCGRCGQPLSDATSISRGYGPLCWEHVRQERAQARLGVRHSRVSAGHTRRVVAAVRAALLAGVLG